jgi:hypothetical protein
VRIYLASVYVTGGAPESANSIAYPHILESFYHINRESYPRMFRRDKRKIFLDSGAFSAFTKGVKIKLEELAKYITKNQDTIEFAANLDDLSTSNKDQAAEGTWLNQKRLEALVPKGVYVVPVFHVREHPRYLQRLVDNYPFIAIGGMVPESQPNLLKLLDEFWDKYLTDTEGRPRCRVHGFGLTALTPMLRYPWWSVDSSSWQKLGSFGRILVPVQGRVLTVSVSERQPNRRDMDAHYDSMSPLHRQTIKRVCEERGFDIEVLRKDYVSRQKFCMATYKELMGSNNRTFKKTVGDFFS